MNLFDCGFNLMCSCRWQWYFHSYNHNVYYDHNDYYMTTMMMMMMMMKEKNYDNYDFSSTSGSIGTMMIRMMRMRTIAIMMIFLSAVLSIPRAFAPQVGGWDPEICDIANLLLGHLQEVCPAGGFLYFCLTFAGTYQPNHPNHPDHPCQGSFALLQFFVVLLLTS